MAIYFDDGGSSDAFNPADWGVSTKPAKRGIFGAANDYIIEAANAVLGGAKSIIDFAQPGTELASQIEALVREGEEKQSDVAKRAKQELGQSIEEGGMEALKGVGKYVVQSPGLAISQAVGSFVAPGVAIKGAGMLGRGLGAGERAIAAGRSVGPLRAADEAALAARGVRPYEMTAGVATGAALSGGDAAGDAYQQVYEAQTNLGVNPEEAKRLATEAARKASVVPALIGGATGVLGAEAQLFSGAKRSGSSILKSAGSEALQEAVEEGSTKLSANIAAMQYGVDTTPMRGVVGAAALGGALGGITGGGVAFATRRQSGSLLQDSNDSLTGNLTPDDDGIKSAINEDRQMSLFSADELMPQIEPRASELINPYNVGGYVGAQQAGLDTGLQFTNTGGQQNMVFGAGPVQEVQTGASQTAAPAAQAAQSQTQPAPSGQQAPQIDPQILSETGQRYGLTQSQMPGTGAAVVNIGGRNVYGTNSVKQFLTELSIADQGKSDVQKQLEAAVFKSGTMSVQPTVTAKALSAAATKQLEKLQINEADSLETAAQILNDQIRALGDANKKATDKTVETLARTYEALTGSVSPAFTQILEGAKNVQTGQKQQVSTRVGTVSVGGGAPASGTGLNVQPANVQSQQPGSQPSGQNGVENVPGGEGGTRPGGGGSVNTDVSTSSQASSSEVTEGTPTEKEDFAKKLFTDVFGERDGLIVYDLLEVTGNQAVIAAKYEIDRTVVSKVKNKYFETNTGKQSKALWFKPKYQVALKNEVIAQGMSLQDVYTFLSNESEAQKEMENLIVKDFDLETVVEGAEDTTPVSAEEQGAPAAELGEDLLEAKAETKADERDTNLTFVGSEKGLSQTSDVSKKSNWRASIKKNRKKLKEVSDAHLQDAAMAVLEGEIEDATLLEDISTELRRRETLARASKGGRETVEEENAVQESSTEEVDVRKQTGNGRALAKRDTEKQAAPEETEDTDELATREEDAEDAWNSLVTSKEVEALGLAEWVELSEAQQALVLRLDDPSTLTLRNVEKILALEDDTRTIDVEAREISPGERRMLENGMKQLPNGQIATLEEHYGAKSGTAEFFDKLATDITNYINKGAESVAAAIRGIIKSMAEGMVAVGLVFNPAVQYSGFDYDIEAIYKKAQDQKTQIPADAKAKMSPLAQAVYRDMAATAKKTGKGFIIADKQAGMIHAFNADGSLLVQDSALFGKDIGDKVSTSSFKGGPKITPAGKFTLKVSENTGYAGGYVLGLEETFDTSENSWVAIHAAYLGNTGEKRLERLASADAKDKRISYGCINTTHETFLNKFKPNLNKFDGGMVFVLPEETVNIAAVKEGRFNVQRVNFRDWQGEGLGVVGAMRELKNEGLDGVVDLVDEYQLLPEDDYSDGTYEIVDGKVVVAFKTSVLKLDTRYGGHVVRHEFGHVIDDAAKGGIYSTTPQMALRVQDGKVTAIGAVAEEVFNLYKTDTAWNEFMSYPFERTEYSPERMQMEMFAQLWSMYTDPVLRQEYMSKSPKASAYMKEVVAHAKRTIPVRVAEKRAQKRETEKGPVRVPGARPEKGQTGARQGPLSVKAGRTKQALTRPLSRDAVDRNIRRLPPGLQRPTRTTYTTLANWARKGMDYIAFTPVIIDRAIKAGLSSANKYLSLNQQRGEMAKRMEEDVQRIVDMYANVPEENRGTGDRSVNRYIYDSTRRGVWGFQPTNRSDKVDVDPELSIRFKRLSPEAQEFIRAVFKHGDAMLALKKKTVMEFTNSEYDAAIEQAKKDGDAKLEASLTADKKADLKKFDSLFRLREGIPYAPIKRIGKYVVIAKSEEYRQAERDGDTKQLRELEKDPDHYHVSFKDTEAQARALQQSLVDEGHFGGDESVEIGERDQYENELYGGNNILQALTKLRAQIDARASSEKAEERAGAATMRRIVTDLYLESLAESSARKNEMRRKGVAGEVDMLQSFGLQGAADARFLSALQYGKQTQDAIQEMRQQVRTGDGDRLRKSELYNELMARYAQTLNFEPMPVTQKINRLTSVWFLATSPGYYLQNLTQPYMMSLPLMAAKHDITRASTALAKAYTQLGEVFQSAKLFEQQFDYSKVPADVRKAIKTLVDRGRIDIGIDTELGSARIEGEGAFTTRWNKVDKGLRLTVQKVEILNRLSTAMAAYRLELQRTGSEAKAVDYADQILVDTHGDYSTFAAPRAFNTNIGKVALQFRKFQLIQLSLMAKLIKDAYTGKDRAVAIKALTYILGNTAVMAGIVGLPGMSAIAWILGQLLGDDDEPYILEKELRDYIGDEDLANMITRGVPSVAGADLSGKIGMGNMLSVLPFTEIDKLNAQKTYEIIGTLVGGPAGGLVARAADGMGYMANGDTWKGLELLTPKGVGDAMKAYRIANEGVTNRRGDVLLPPEELGDLDTVWRAFGISPVKQTVRSAKQGFKVDYETQFAERSTEIKRDYTRAVAEGDNQAKEEARQEWKKLQEARKRNGFTVQPLSELLTAPREQRKRQRLTKEGVQFEKSSRQFVERLQ